MPDQSTVPRRGRRSGRRCRKVVQCHKGRRPGGHADTEAPTGVPDAGQTRCSTQSAVARGSGCGCCAAPCLRAAGVGRQGGCCAPRPDRVSHPRAGEERPAWGNGNRRQSSGRPDRSWRGEPAGGRPDRGLVPGGGSRCHRGPRPTPTRDHDRRAITLTGGSSGGKWRGHRRRSHGHTDHRGECLDTLRPGAWTVRWSGRRHPGGDRLPEQPRWDLRPQAEGRGARRPVRYRAEQGFHDRTHRQGVRHDRVVLPLRRCRRRQVAGGESARRRRIAFVISPSPGEQLLSRARHSRRCRSGSVQLLQGPLPGRGQVGRFHLRRRSGIEGFVSLVQGSFGVGRLEIPLRAGLRADRDRFHGRCDQHEAARGETRLPQLRRREGDGPAGQGYAGPSLQAVHHRRGDVLRRRHRDTGRCRPRRCGDPVDALALHR